MIVSLKIIALFFMSLTLMQDGSTFYGICQSAMFKPSPHLLFVVLCRGLMVQSFKRQSGLCMARFSIEILLAFTHIECGVVSVCRRSGNNAHVRFVF